MPGGLTSFVQKSAICTKHPSESGLGASVQFSYKFRGLRLMEPPRPDSLISIFDAQAMRNRNLGCRTENPPPPCEFARDHASANWSFILRGDFKRDHGWFHRKR